MNACLTTMEDCTIIQNFEKGDMRSPNTNKDEPRVNEKINALQIRLIDENGINEKHLICFYDKSGKLMASWYNPENNFTLIRETNLTGYYLTIKYSKNSSII